MVYSDLDSMGLSPSLPFLEFSILGVVDKRLWLMSNPTVVWKKDSIEASFKCPPPSPGRASAWRIAYLAKRLNRPPAQRHGAVKTRKRATPHKGALGPGVVVSPTQALITEFLPAPASGYHGARVRDASAPGTGEVRARVRKRPRVRRGKTGGQPSSVTTAEAAGPPPVAPGLRRSRRKINPEAAEGSGRVAEVLTAQGTSPRRNHPEEVGRSPTAASTATPPSIPGSGLDMGPPDERVSRKRGAATDVGTSPPAAQEVPKRRREDIRAYLRFADSLETR